jgi:hypothetical protein
MNKEINFGKTLGNMQDLVRKIRAELRRKQWDFELNHCNCETMEELTEYADNWESNFREETERLIENCYNYLH